MHVRAACSLSWARWARWAAAVVVAAGACSAQADAVHVGRWNVLPLAAAAPPAARPRMTDRLPAPAWVLSLPNTSLWPPVSSSDGTLYLAGSDGARALDSAGRVLWYAAVGPVAGTPVLLPSGLLLLVLGDGTLSLLTRDGHASPLPAELPRSAGAPLVASRGLVVAGDLAGVLRAFDLSGTALDSVPVALPPPLSVASRDGTTFVAAGRDARIAWLSLGTGLARVLAVPERVIAGPAIDEHGEVWLLGDGDLLVRLDADGRVVMQVRLSRGLRPTLAVGRDGAARVATSDGQLLCIASDGTERWRRGTEGAPGPITLDADDGAVFVTSRGMLYAIDARGEALFHVAVQAPEAQAVTLGEDRTLYVTARGMLQAWR